MRIVLLYAGLLALLFVVLSLRTLLMRRRLRIAVGDGGNPALLRAMRVHANSAEYVPLTLLLIALVESAGARPLYVHGLGAAPSSPAACRMRSASAASTRTTPTASSAWR